MIKRLQRLKSKRGFSLVELIVVIAIIAVMSSTVLVGSSNRREKIEEANMAATDFYVALQNEFLNFQFFDGPLTMTLSEQYSTFKDNPGGLVSTRFGGIKYYPAVGGNYPFDGTTALNETHLNGKPKNASLYVEFYVKGGLLQQVNYDNDIGNLLILVSPGNDDDELCLILKQEMKNKINYKDGYYYAKISYTVPTLTDASKELNKYDYRSNIVKIDWTLYCANELTDDDDTCYFNSAHFLKKNGVCGVHTTKDYSSLGTTGTSVKDF